MPLQMPIQPSAEVERIAGEVMRCLNQTPHMAEGEEGSIGIELNSPSASLWIDIEPDGRLTASIHPPKK